MDKPGVVVVVRCHMERHGWWNPMLGMWLVQLHGAEQNYGHKIAVRVVCGAPNAAASANLAVDAFLNDHPGYEWLCIVDNDVCPPMDLMNILEDMPDETDGIGPISHMYQHGKTLVQQGWGGFQKGFQGIANPEVPQRLEVDQLGGGAWFVRRRAFEKLKKPYFVELFEPETHMLMVSDDVYFQYMAREAGCRFLCDTRFVVQHFHSVDLSSLTIR
jgi:hypothetical protein